MPAESLREFPSEFPSESLPDFAALQPESLAAPLGALLQEAERALQTCHVTEHAPRTYAGLMISLEAPLQRLRFFWGLIEHLHATMDTPALRQLHEAWLPKLTDFYTRLEQDAALCDLWQQLDEAQLTPAERRVRRLRLEDFRYGGVALSGAGRTRFAQIQARLSECARLFSEHVMDATDAFVLSVTPAQLAGLPADAQTAARAAAEQAGDTAGARLSLHAPVYWPFMKYGQNRALRETLYRAYVTRASEFGAAALDNSALITETLALRRERAQWLGFASYAESSLAQKMAATPARALDFVRTLAARAQSKAREEWRELCDFAASDLALRDLQPWDIAFASEALRAKRYGYREEDLRPFFPLPQVLTGLFALARQIFGVQIAPANASLWHTDARYLRLTRSGLADHADETQPFAGLYLDLFARTGKRPGAWMDGLRERSSALLGGHLPLAVLVGDLTPGLPGQDAHLTHSELETLLHEFGHGLHHLLTEQTEPGISGIDGVEWDAVELPSQFMENFCWHWPTLQSLSATTADGRTLPRALFDRLLAARNFQISLHTLRQAEYALFDLCAHDAQPRDAAALQRLMDDVRREVCVTPILPQNRMQHSFTHIFAGGYAAGYYSYQWAEVLAADAFAAFTEEGILNSQTGARFRREILEAGGLRPAADSFRAFRGRDAQIDALLRQYGFVKISNQ